VNLMVLVIALDGARAARTVSLTRSFLALRSRVMAHLVNRTTALRHPPAFTSNEARPSEIVRVPRLVLALILTMQRAPPPGHATTRPRP
jgi:hypothetical protein